MRTQSQRRRVPALAADERRAALIEATVPLLREHGMSVSTRQIAGAAGVAEGTIFGVFPDKASLLRAAVLRALDPEPLVATVTNLAGAGDLRSRLRILVEQLRQRMASNAQLIIAVRHLAGDPAQACDFADKLYESRRRMVAALAMVFEPDRDRLRRDPDTAAQLLLMLVTATVQHIFADPGGLGDLDSDDIVSLLLDGLLVRPAAPTGDTI